ncbi:MAG: hypothetical protein Q9225_007451 [Loekoesia sp. 1 TL-2023]
MVGKGVGTVTHNQLLSTNVTKWIDCTVKMPNEDESLKRMISSLQELQRRQEARKFWPIFLNRNPSAHAIWSVVTEEATDLDINQMLYGTLTELKQDSLNKNFNHVELSLQTRANQCAEDTEGKQVLMSGWNDKDEDEPYAALYDESGTRIRDVEDSEEEPKVDMFEQLRHFNRKLPTSKYKDWSVDDKKHAKKANIRVQNYVMSNARLIITTTNGIGGQYIKTPFGKGNGEPIFIFMEEASQEPEPNTWMFMKLAELHNVMGFYLIGDQEQLKPAAYSATATPPINEFGPQITMSLFTRLINNSGFPSVQLRKQYCAHPELMAYTTA